jgi:hypothetical protein
MLNSSWKNADPVGFVKFISSVFAGSVGIDVRESQVLHRRVVSAGS